MARCPKRPPSNWGFCEDGGSPENLGAWKSSPVYPAWSTFKESHGKSPFLIGKSRENRGKMVLYMENHHL